jgi:hypothetical protein
MFRPHSDNIADHHLSRSDCILFFNLKDTIRLMVVKEHACVQPQRSEVGRGLLQKGLQDSNSPNVYIDSFIRHLIQIWQNNPHPPYPTTCSHALRCGCNVCPRTRITRTRHFFHANCR